MRIRIAAVGTRMPDWAQAAVEEYTRRMPAECRVELAPVAAAPRPKKPDTARIKRDEAVRLRAQIPDGALVVALDEGGRAWSTQQLAAGLEGWMADGRDVCMLIGGADGLEAELLGAADLRLSLSSLTLPHALARVLLVEALYRAWSVVAGHPYHRA